MLSPDNIWHVFCMECYIFHCSYVTHVFSIKIYLFHSLLYQCIKWIIHSYYYYIDSFHIVDIEPRYLLSHFMFIWIRTCLGWHGTVTGSWRYVGWKSIVCYSPNVKARGNWEWSDAEVESKPSSHTSYIIALYSSIVIIIGFQYSSDVYLMLHLHIMCIQ